MYSSNSNNNLDDNTIKTQSKIIWIGLVSGTLMLAICILFMESLLKLEPIMPEMKTLFIGLCVFTIPLAFLLKGRFRRIEREIIDNVYIGVENSTTVLQRYITYMLIGASLADLPAMFGLVLYIMTGDGALALLFVAVSFVLGFLYKPAL